MFFHAQSKAVQLIQQWNDSRSLFLVINQDKLNEGHEKQGDGSRYRLHFCTLFNFHPFESLQRDRKQQPPWFPGKLSQSILETLCLALWVRNGPYRSGVLGIPWSQKANYRGPTQTFELRLYALWVALIKQRVLPVSRNENSN